MPGDVFSTSGRYAYCLRVSCGSTWHPRIEKGVETLGALPAREERAGKGRVDRSHMGAGEE